MANTTPQNADAAPQSDSENTTQDDSAPVTSNTVDYGTPAPQPAEIDSTTGKRKGYAAAQQSGAVKFTDVTPGSLYNGIKVPPSAASTDGKDWYDKTGSVLVDEDVDPDGSANEFSSKFIQGWAQDAVENGVNPIAIEKIITPWAELANKTKTFEMQNSDNILMKQGLDMDNQTKFTNLSNEIAGNLATMDPVSGAMMISQIRNNQPPGAPNSPVLARFGVQPTDTPAQALQKIQASGPGQTAIQALKAQKVGIQAAQQGIVASQQGMGVQRFETGQQAVGSLEAGNNAVINSATTANKAQTALQLYDQLRASGSIGGPYNNIINNLEGIIQKNGPNAGAAQELKSYLSLDNLSGLKNAFGQRVAASEFNAISPTQINPNWQANAIHDFLTNISRYSQADLQNKKATQSGIITNVKKLPFGIDTSPYEQQLSGAEKATQTAQQSPAGGLTAPHGLSETQFATWANQHGISNKNVGAAFKAYQGQ